MDVRLIAATNRDLKEAIAKGSFREDLYYRLNVVNIHIPPLRDRKDDIPLLIAAFLREFSQENGKAIEGIDPKARRALVSYSWPGNVRQLRNSIESAVVLCKGSVITVEDLPPGIRGEQGGDVVRLSVGSSLADAEKELIRSTLDPRGRQQEQGCRGAGYRAEDPPQEAAGVRPVKKTIVRRLFPACLLFLLTVVLLLLCAAAAVLIDTAAVSDREYLAALDSALRDAATAASLAEPAPAAAGAAGLLRELLDAVSAELRAIPAEPRGPAVEMIVFTPSLRDRLADVRASVLQPVPGRL